MTGRRYAHSRATVATGGSISDRTPCQSYPGVYDALVDVGGAGRSVDPEAVEAARNLCATCLLNTPDVARRCLDENRGERWRNIVLGKPVRDRTPSPSAIGDAARGKHQRNRDARLADLRALIKAGAQVEEVCAQLGTSHDGLWKWCRKWGHEAEWRAIKPPQTSNQYQRRDDIGQITTRRRGKASAA